MRRLTYDFHLVGGVDLSGSVGHVAGVLPAVLRRQVLQAQSPPLLLPFLSLLVRQRPTVLQPHDVGARVSARRALQTHRAADRPGDDALPHLRRLRETWTHCEWRRENPVTIRKRLKQSVSPLAAGAGQEINNTEINNFPPLGELQMETRRGGREKSEQKKLLAEINGLQSSFIFTSSVQLCRPVETERTGTDHGIHQRVLNVTFIRSTERSKPRYLQRLRDRRRAQRCLKPREPVSIRDVTIFTIRQIKTDLGFRRHVLIDLYKTLQSVSLRFPLKTLQLFFCPSSGSSDMLA